MVWQKKIETHLNYDSKKNSNVGGIKKVPENNEVWNFANHATNKIFEGRSCLKQNIFLSLIR